MPTIGAHSLDPTRLSELRLAVRQTRMLTRLAECRGRQDLFNNQTPEILDSLRDLARVQSTESSNRIEGVVAPRDRVEALVHGETTPVTRPEQEIAGYRDALALIHESAQHMAFSGNVLLQLHGLILRYTTEPRGQWKAADNKIVQVRDDGTIARVRFTPVPALQTPSAVETLVTAHAQATDQPGSEPLVVVPLAVLDFLCIHPFKDGNGRVSRLLTLMLLYQAGYEVGRYISLERIVEDSRETYYEVLERCSQGWHDGTHEVMPWLEYFWGVLLRAYGEFEERVGELRTARGAKTELVRDAVMRRIGPFGIANIESECPGVSRDMVRYVLRKLRDDGILEVQGKGRGSKWVRRDT